MLSGEMVPLIYIYEELVFRRRRKFNGREDCYLEGMFEEKVPQSGTEKGRYGIFYLIH